MLGARERVEERLDEVLRRAQAERRGEAVRLDVPRAVRVRERALRLGLVRADVEVELAREARVEEAVVGQDARDGREDLALAQWRSLVVLLAPDVLQLDCELRSASIAIYTLNRRERTLSVAFVLLCRSKYRRVTGPASAYSARLR